jgi:leader peptidase (prepilin peptidase) / N-methyltransferase
MHAVTGLVQYLVAAAFGLCLGSFLNVCIHRLPRGLSVVRPRSACPVCAAMIAWHDNIPLVSWIALGGRCRSCRAAIALRYPMIEAATGALAVAALAHAGPTLEAAVLFGFAAALVALILIDAGHQILPDAITLPGIAAGVALAPLRAAAASGGDGRPLRALAHAAGAAALGYAIPWAINGAYHGWQALRGVPRDRREDGIGRGDYKLLAMIGAFLGWQRLLFTLFAGAVSGAAWGLTLMLTRGYGWKSKLPFGVFLGAAAILAAFAGDRIVGAYLALVGVAP